MQELEVSIGIIEQNDTYLLQQRGADPVIGAAGLIGAFGGKIETGESPLEAVCRELSEETSLSPTAEDFKHLGVVNVIADRNHKPIRVMAHVFYLQVPADQMVESREGGLVRIAKAEAAKVKDRLTPATRATFEQLI